MKTIILCGGIGSRMKEETDFKPKPLVQIGGRPILWHIMKIYAHHGYKNFVVALGYKGDMIKEYFLKERSLSNDFTLDMATQDVLYHTDNADHSKITFAETGLESLTGERILLAQKYITEEEFMVTYGDGVADVNIQKLVEFHRSQKTIGTITGVHAYSQYGLVRTNDKGNLIKKFEQKPLLFDYINGGFMVFKREAFEYFQKGSMEEGLAKLANDGQLSLYKHEGFWGSMDTYNDVVKLNKLWEDTKPWAVWKQK